MCNSTTYRFSNINGGSINYTSTHRTYSYYGYENEDNGNKKLDRINGRVVYGTGGSDYFIDWVAQVDDAYANYLEQ